MFSSDRLRFVIALLLIVAGLPALSQSTQGRPGMINFSAKDYKAHNQNFTVLQDQRGMIYVGNTAGILEFDGEEWDLVFTEEGTIIRSMAMDRLGRIYVGTRGEIGYLEPNDLGETEFKSLNHVIPAEHRIFKDVWHAWAGAQGVYFVAEDRIFWWYKDRMEIILPDHPIAGTDELYGSLLIQYEHGGLAIVNHNRLEELYVDIPGAAIEDVTLRFVQSTGQHTALVGTQRNGLYLMEDNDMRKSGFEADEFLKANLVTCGIHLADGRIAVGTERGGVAILSNDGRLINLINKASGLPDENVRSLFVDREGALWVALNNGISRLDLNSPLSFFDGAVGPEGEVNDILQFDNRLYFATSQGLFWLQRNNPADMEGGAADRMFHFEALPGLSYACYQLRSHRGTLYVASSGGIFSIRGEEIQRISQSYAFSVFPAEHILAADDLDGTVFAGELSGLALYEHRAGQTEALHRWDEFNSEITDLQPDKDELWVQTSSSGLFCLRLGTPGDWANWPTLAVDTAMGLPDMYDNYLNPVQSPTGREMLMATQDGFFRFIGETRSLDSAKTALPGLYGMWATRLVTLGNRMITVGGDETGLALYNQDGDGHWVEDEAVFRPVKEFVSRVVYADPSGLVWVGGPDGVLRYDPSVEKNFQIDFNCLLREIYLADDSMLYAGNHRDSNGVAGLLPPNALEVKLDPSKDYIGFRFAATSFDFGSANEFRFYLEGYEKDWSIWTDNRQKEYTNLDDGTYTFRVQARNIYGHESEEAAFQFTIITPWYEMWWAYVVYVAAFIFLLVVVARLRAQQLEKEKKALERIIEERTAEITDQKEEIEQQSEVLTAKNKELEKINLMVKAINAEIEFNSVLQSIIDSTASVRAVERSAGLVLDREGNYRIRAAHNWDEDEAELFRLSASDAEEIFTTGANEVGEEVNYLPSGYRSEAANQFQSFGSVVSCIVVAIRIEDKIEGYLLLENLSKPQAFRHQDFELLGNLKEHIVGAYIKTGILENLQETLNNLKETQAKLVSQEKMAGLGQLTAGIAHEINNPINFVSGNIKPLRRDFEDIKEVLEAYSKIDKDSDLEDELEEIEELKEDIDLDYVLDEVSGLIDDIATGAERTAEIVRELKDFSRLDENNVKMANLEDGLDSTLNILRNKYKEKIEVERNYAGIPEIECFPGKVNQVFMNILNNAIQAIPEKGTIFLTTELRGEDKVAIKIRDTGTGMSDEVRAKIFDPFFTTKDVGEGTGLGMSITFGIIEDHGGTIELETEVGVGTEFTLIFPKKQARDD